MITLYLIRHGQTVWNSSGRYQGRTDVALSEKGIAQAEKTKERFRTVSLDGVISSPLKRAAHTAKGIAQIHGLPLERVGIMVRWRFFREHYLRRIDSIFNA